MRGLINIKYIDRKREKIYRQTVRQTYWHTGILTYRQTAGHSDWPTGRKTDIHTDRKTDR